MARTHEQAAQWQNPLAPHIVERLARETPDNKYGEWVSEDSVVVITYAQPANVIDGLAWLLVEQLGGPGRYGANPKVLAYVGTNDVRYSALVLAAAKAGYTGAFLAQLIVGAIPHGNFVIAPVATAIPTAQGVVNALKQFPAEVAILVPSVVAELAQNPELLNYCAAHLQTIIYIGSDLPQEISDRVAAKIHLRCVRSATETGIVPQLLPFELSSAAASASNPEVSGAIVIGAQRFQAALLIKPASATLLTTAEQATLIERIWPSIEESNRKAPAHVRLEKSFVLVLPADRRLIRAAKGTFTRAPSISQYTEEIEKLYNNADLLSNDDDYPNGDTAHYYTPTGPDATIISSDRRSFQRPDFAISTIYQNPTVSQSRTAILTPNKNEQDELEIMEALLTTYREQIKTIPVPKKPVEYTSQVLKPINVLLTGSTGTIGSYLLQALLNRDGIANVFCLNCGEDGGKAKQHKIFTASGFATTKLNNRVTFIKADLESPSLGMDEHAYKSLSGEIDLIIHAAWPVNFNLALSAFRSQFAGIINLLTLAASTNSTTRFVFVSSIAVVEGYTAGPALEEIIFGLKTPAPFGYARAKFLSELLVDAAGQHLGETISTTIIRIGQIAGPVLNPGL
ncbi:hypothetical protein ACHAPG_003108 [Botrytis cinerea]